MPVHGHFFIKDGNGGHTNAAYGDIDSSPMEPFEFIPVPNGPVDDNGNTQPSMGVPGPPARPCGSLPAPRCCDAAVLADDCVTFN
jgi:hypothetical protein